MEAIDTSSLVVAAATMSQSYLKEVVGLDVVMYKTETVDICKRRDLAAQERKSRIGWSTCCEG